MLVQKICGVILLFVGLGQILFAERLVNYSIRAKSSKMMHFDQWPVWGISAAIWTVRFGGILAITGGILLIIKNWK
jgi:hypothetical protein